jgi:hypothetical protein
LIPISSNAGAVCLDRALDVGDRRLELDKLGSNTGF